LSVITVKLSYNYLLARLLNCLLSF